MKRARLRSFDRIRFVAVCVSVALLTCSLSITPLTSSKTRRFGSASQQNGNRNEQGHERRVASVPPQARTAFRHSTELGRIGGVRVASLRKHSRQQLLMVAAAGRVKTWHSCRDCQTETLSPTQEPIAETRHAQIYALITLRFL